MDKNSKDNDGNSNGEMQFEEIADFTGRVAETDVISHNGSSGEDISGHRIVIDDVVEGPVDADGDADIDIESLSTEVDRITQIGKYQPEESVTTVEDSDAGMDELKDKLHDLSIEDVGNIGLREAERIASEGVLLLTEEDLVEELEVLDLVPVELETVSEEGDVTVSEEKIPEERGAVAEQEYVEDRIPSEEIVVDELPEEDATAGVAIGEIDAGETVTGEEGELLLDTDAVPSDEEIEADAALLERDESIQEPESEEIVQEEISEDLPEPPAAVEIVDEMALDSDGTELSEDDYEGGIIDGEELEEADLIRDEMDDDIYLKKITESDMGDFDDSEGEAEKDVIYDADLMQDQESMSISGEIEFDDEVISPEGIEEKKVTSVVKEQIPLELAGLDSGESVYIIDDEIVKSEETDRGAEFEERELEKISTDIVEAVESKAKLLEEADADRDRMMAPVMKGAESTFDDLLIDFQEAYTYSDDELSFIDNEIVGADYSEIQEMADEDERDEAVGISHEIEYLGLTADEIDIIENNAFSREYENIDIDAVVKKTGIGLDGAPSDFISIRDYRYSIPREDSLLADEKESIEEDIISKSAYIFEENVEDIKEKLDKLSVRDEEVIKERVPDISNKIVIIDDESDVDRFVKSLPEDKQRNIKKLLRYLDGLFEKLPEEVVENFSKSEYFNLYMQVLDDLGI